MSNEEHYKSQDEIREQIERLERQGFKEDSKTDLCFRCEFVRMTVYFKRNQHGGVVESVILCHNCGRMKPWNAWRSRKERVEHALKKGWLKDDIPHRPGW